MPGTDLALTTPAPDSPPPAYLANDDPKVDALVEKLRALVLAEMCPAGMVPDPVTMYAVGEHLADALAWVDLCLTVQAEEGPLHLDDAGEWVRAAARTEPTVSR